MRHLLFFILTLLQGVYAFAVDIHTVSNPMEFIRAKVKTPDCEDSFHVVDLSSVQERYHFWKQVYPNVKPFYAVKSNHDPMIVQTLADLGAGFDCASVGEIDQVLELGVEPDRIIFAHPRKSKSAIAYAQKVGIRKMTFDSIEELDKMLAFAPDGEFVLRITTDDSHSVDRFSDKFGATILQSYAILQHAAQKKANIIGVSFHVGCLCKYVDAYLQALADAAHLFRYARQEYGMKFRFVDIGGGWPSNDDETMAAHAAAINKTLHSQFSEDVEFISEPGSFFCNQSMTIAFRIVGKKVLEAESKRFAYYVTNGVFGSFICSLYYQNEAEKLRQWGWEFDTLYPTDKPKYQTILWGPTCDGKDMIHDQLMLPELQTDDFIIVKKAGAYTCALQTPFNQIPVSKPYYMINPTAVE